MDQQSIRLILFMVIAFGILMVSQTLFSPPAPQGVSAPTAVTQPKTPTASVPPSLSPAAKKASAKPMVRILKDIPAASVEIYTPLFHAVLSNEGAILQSYELKKYSNRRTKNPLNLVETDTDSPRPLEISYAPAGDLKNIRWEIVGGARTLRLAEKEKAEVVFRTIRNGLEIVKKIRFDGESYVQEVALAVRAVTKAGAMPGALVVEGPADLGHEEFTGTSSRAQGFRSAVFSGQKLEVEKPKGNQDSREFAAPVAWASLADQFYLAAFIPDNASGSASARIVRDFHPQILPVDEEGDKGVIPKIKSFARAIHLIPPAKAPVQKAPTQDSSIWVARPQISYAAPALGLGEGFTRQFKLFLGPQELDHLKTLGVQLEKALDFGWFEFISLYLLLLLKWFYSWCHNWGLAVILLSVLVKLVLWWPTHHSYKSMSVNQKKMQEIQPKLDAIKKKHAGDTAKQNEETMKLYQQANINMTSGCLPMLLQMPVFFALYSALSCAIELRGAPFIFWIQDLSLKDDYLVLPLLMGASMFIQQKMSSQSAPAGSASQQKIMLWLFPIMLTFMSFGWPSGLLLYWVVTNILGIVQQRMVNRSIKNATA